MKTFTTALLVSTVAGATLTPYKNTKCAGTMDSAVTPLDDVGTSSAGCTMYVEDWSDNDGYTEKIACM